MGRFDSVVALVSGGARGMVETPVRGFVVDARASAMLFLANDGGSFMTRAELAVDGSAVPGPIAPVG
ncbi:MAG: hypothetical protein H7269_12565 [Cellulomonas sp.]|nr:hypothetical protein [Cellulomonas sp.]